MAYEMVMPYHLHMPSYFLETFTEYPYLACMMQLSTVSFKFGVKANLFICISLGSSLA